MRKITLSIVISVVLTMSFLGGCGKSKKIQNESLSSIQKDLTREESDKKVEKSSFSRYIASDYLKAVDNAYMVDKNFLSMTEEEIVSAYGKPNEKRTSTGAKGDITELVYSDIIIKITENGNGFCTNYYSEDKDLSNYYNIIKENSTVSWNEKIENMIDDSNPQKHYLCISNDYNLQSSTYSDIVSEYLGGVEGTMIEKSGNTIYIAWYLKDVPELPNKYLTGSRERIEYLIYYCDDCRESKEGFDTVYGKFTDKEGI